MESEQLKLQDLLPGSAGGRALKHARGRAYFVELGRRGGEATRNRYGVEHLRELGQRGGLAAKRQIRTIARTIVSWDGSIERRVPYWPPTATKRRQRPLYVRIQLEPPPETQ